MFLRNNAEAIAAIDICAVRTVTFDLLFAFLVLGHDRRQLVWFEVTRHPTAEWLARQITEAYPWASVPTYLLRNNDRAYGHAFTSRVRGMGIRDRPISTRSPWQNGCGTSDRHLASRVSGSDADLRRSASAADPPMRPITIKCARTWHYTKMHLCIEPSSDLASLSASRSWPGYITNTSGYDFRKGQRWALRVSNAVAIIILFICGYAFARNTGLRPWPTGLAMVAVGAFLVGIAIVLGG